MKISNFRDLKSLFDPAGHAYYIAKVDVESGSLWWRKVGAVDVARTTMSPFWFFVDSGEFTPGCIVENLERGDKAKRLLSQGPQGVSK